jgi:fibronectin type 3 domain-containing protein
MKNFTLNQPAYYSGVEAGNHFKNGANPKSQTSRAVFSPFAIVILALSVFAFAAAFVSCSDDDDNSNNASFVAAPTNVTAYQSGQCVVLSWNEAPGATYYEVYRSSASAPNSSYQKIGEEEEAFSEDWSPLSGDNYYKVKAVKESGSSEIRSEFSSHVYCNYSSNNTGGGGSTTAPSAPSGVTSSAQSSSSISVSWYPASGATSYKVYYEIGNSTIKNLAGTVSGTSYTHTGLTASTTYYYYIVAVNSAGESGYSPNTHATTSSSGSGGGDGGGTTTPSAPANVTATAQSSSSISVSWSSVSSATSYKVYYEVGSSSTKNLAGTVSGTSYTHTGLTASTTYYYYIKAVNSAGESGYSPNALATTQSSGSGGDGGGTTNYSPCPVSSPTTSGTSSIRVSWSAATGTGCGSPTSYEVYKQDPNTGSYNLLTTTSSTSYSDNSTHPGINRYGIKAKNSYGTSAANYAYSSEVSLSRPISFTASKSGSNVNFSWSKVAEATGYQIFSSSTVNGTYFILDEISENKTSHSRSYPATSGTTVYFKIKAVWKTNYGSPSSVYSDLSNYKSVTF